MKKIIFLYLICLVVFLIYLGLQDKKIYYVSMGDKIINQSSYNQKIIDYLKNINKYEKYVDISTSNYRIIDLINIINNNNEINNKTLKNILIKADLLTISIGYNDIISKINIYNNNELNNYLNGFINDLNKLFNLIRQYTKEDIVFFSLYSLHPTDDLIINSLNDKIKELCDNYKIKYIDISDISITNNSISEKDINKLYYFIKNFIDNKIIN